MNEASISMVGQKQTRRSPGCLKTVRITGIMGLVIIAIGGIIVTFFPDVAAQNVDRLRNIIGDEPVAQIETFVLNVQDQAQQLAYQLGLTHPAAPWTPPPNDSALIALASTIVPASTPNSPQPMPDLIAEATNLPPPSIPATAPPVVAQLPTMVPGVPTIAANDMTLMSTPTVIASVVPATIPVISSNIVLTAASTVDPAVVSTIVPATNSTVAQAVISTIAPNIAPTATPILILGTPVVTSAARVWQLSSLTPFGKVTGEGQWQPYMLSADGRTVVAYRTFLQPDPQRPYTFPAIVAINLQVTRLHFVLGTVDPAPATPQPSRTGLIPAADMQPGVLLATFNGGFKARHGQYGAMADGLIGLPARTGDATVAIYKNGSVHIGQWGTDITDSPDLVAWRQNGKMLIRNGQINPATAQTTVSWGLTIQGNAVTWRSALGLSADGQTLYYIGGPHLDVPALTRTMAQTGAANALQLDINYFWVNFAAIRSNGNQLIAEPLISDMTQKVDRYLKVSTDDFFYVTQ
jgi:hypothetical protein